ncbi:MAG: LEPR-XLL domain-containing protein, partial [Planctomycetota bacterium]
MTHDFSRLVPRIEPLEERILLDASVTVSAGTTVMIDVNNDTVMDHAFAVTDGTVDLHYELTGSYNAATKELTLIGGIGDLNAVIVTASGTNGADLQASYSEVESISIGSGLTLETASFGVLTGGKSGDSSGAVRSVSGAGTLKDLSTTGDLNTVNVTNLTGTISASAVSMTGADSDVSVSITEGGTSSLTLSANQNASTIGFAYDASTDALTLNANDTAANKITVTDPDALVDQLTIDSGVVTALDTVQVTGDLDGFTALDSKYASIRVTAASGPLVINDQSSSVTVNPDAAVDLSYTGSTDSLVVNDFSDGASLTLTDASHLVDSLSVTTQAGKALSSLLVTGDLDSFSGGDVDYASLRVTAAVGALAIHDGANTATVNPGSAVDLTYTGSTDALVVNSFTNGAPLTVTDASDLVDSLSITPGPGGMNSLIVIGDLDSFTAQDGDYFSFLVSAANGP